MKGSHLLLSYFLVWCVGLVTIQHGEAAKILCMFSTPSRSHHILGEPLTDALAKQHEVTVITAYKVANPGLYKQVIHVEGLKEVMTREITPNMTDNLPKIFMLRHMTKAGAAMSRHVLLHPEVQQLLKSGAKFDMVITKLFMNDACLGIAQHFDAIPVVFSTLGPTKWTNGLVGNPNNPAYNPNIFLPFGPVMNYWQRFGNIIASVVEEIFHGYHMAAQAEVYEEIFGNLGKTPVATLEQVFSNVSLALVNSHIALSYSRPYVPNMIEIGGIHIKEGGKLPENIQKFMDEAKNGVIFFSLGSNLRSADLPIQTREAILKTFGKLKERVLWKWEDENLPGQPKNVMISPWMPQQSILAHPKLKLFITHGGLLSTSESVYFGVPVIGIPAFGDQHMNMKNAEASGYAITLDQDNLTEETLSQALSTMLGDSSYTDNVKKLSTILRDSAQTPLEKAVYNIEYVLRHKGAPFLRSPSLHLNTFQIFMIDIAFGFLVIGFVLLSVSYLTVRTIYRMCCKKKVAKKNKKEKQR